MLLEARLLSEITTFMKYSKHLTKKKRRENWRELVTRNKNMHIAKFPQLETEITEAYEYVYNKKILPSMRSMQFAGRPVELNNVRMFNCSFLPIDHTDAFSEVMFLLLSGTGVGYSVQTHHVDQLPEVHKPTKSRRYLVGDSIEGWADAVKVLISAYMKGKALPEFDFSDIRAKGALLMTAGGKAPGPEPLKDCLHNIQKILDRKQNGDKITTLEVHDIMCFIADAVLSGGIRRSAMIALFDIDDEEMLTCKFGTWYELNPQRGRSNNSAVIVRHKIDKEVFLNLWKKIEMSGSGEPGFFFTNDKEWGTNPCAEVSLKPFQFCNLCEVNVSDIPDQEEYNARSKAAAFIGTLQASYTNFHYLRDIWKRTTEKEALIGVGMTGIASGVVLKSDMKEAAKIVKTENERVAKLIDINKAARTTVVKPSGTTSLVLGTSSGIHAWHNDYYIRRVRVGKNESIYKYLTQNHPEIVQDEFFKPTQMAVIEIPQRAPEGAIIRTESALDLLNRVGKVWKDWVSTGHRKGENKNNVSVTVSIKPDEWEIVGEWLWQHRMEYTAISCLPQSDHSYIQSPFEDITKERYEELVQHLHKIDLTKVVEEHDDTNVQDELACASGGCEL